MKTDYHSSYSSSSDDGSRAKVLNWGKVDLVGRDQHSEVLREALSRIQQPDAKAETILVHGFSGTGKSKLIYSFLDHETGKNALIWGTGKYEQKSVDEEATRPFSAIADAISSLCDAISESKESEDIKERVRAALNSDELRAIGEVVPTIGLLCADNDINDRRSTALVGEAALIRLMYIFRRLLGAMGSPKTPVVMFLDDVQWADSASRRLLDSIFQEVELHHLLILGTVREGENSSFEISQTAVMPHQKIVCENLSRREVDQVVKQVTGCGEQESQELGSIVFARTGGNPYFMRQFIGSLAAANLLTYNDDQRNFECDVDVVSEQIRSNFVDEIDLTTQSIRAFPHKVQIVIVVAALLGHTIHLSALVSILESKELYQLFPPKLVPKHDQDVTDQIASPEMPCKTFEFTRRFLLKTLKSLLAAGLVERVKSAGQYQFSHDRVQQSALFLLPQDELGKQIKATLGALILELSETNASDHWMVYTATNLLVENFEAGSVEPTKVAVLCLKAASRASSQAAFKTGGKYADSGIKALGKRCWSDHYDLCLALTNVSAELHYACGNTRRSKKRVATIQKRAICVEDKTRAFHVLLKTLTPADAIQETVQGIEDLGVQCPKNAHPGTIVTNIIKAKYLVRGMKPSDVVKLPAMSDRKMKEATKLFGILAARSFDAGDEDRLVTSCLQQLQLTVKHGLSESTPHALASYGVCLAHLGQLEQAHEYGKMAASLICQPRFEVEASLAALPVYAFLWHLKHPMRECVDGLTQAYNDGIRMGDSYFASFALRFRDPMGILTGDSLGRWESEIKRSLKTIREYKQNKHALILEPWAQLVQNLKGKAPDATILKGTFADEDSARSRYNATQSVQARNLIRHTYYAKLVLLYLCGEHSEAHDVHKLQASLPEETSSLYLKLFNALFVSLNYSALAIETRKKKYVKRIAPFRRMIRRFGSAGSPSVPPMLSLLEAELLTFQNKRAKAAGKYQDALRGFKSQKFGLLEAVTYERMGASLTEYDPHVSKMCAVEAYNAYSRYGANIVADRVKKSLNLDI